MSLLLGFANYENFRTGVTVWEDVLAAEAKRYFARRDYGAHVLDITIVWSGLWGRGGRTLIRNGFLRIYPPIRRARVMRSVSPRKRLEYLTDVTLKRVSEHSAYLSRKGFDVSRFLSDLDHFFRVVVPKRIEKTSAEPDILFDELALLRRWKPPRPKKRSLLRPSARLGSAGKKRRS